MHEASSSVESLWQGIVERHEQLRHDRHRPILDPPELYLPAGGISARVRRVAAGAAALLRMAARNRRAGAEFLEPGAGRDSHRSARRAAGRRARGTHCLESRPGAARRRIRRPPRAAARSAARSRRAGQGIREFCELHRRRPATRGHRIARGIGAAPRGAAARDPHRVAAVRRPRAAGAPAAARRARSGQDTQGVVRPAHRRAGGARILWGGPLRRPADHGRGGLHGRVSGARVCRRRQALRAGASAAPGVPLHGRAGGNRTAAQTRRRTVAEGASQGGAAHPRRRRGTPRFVLAPGRARGHLDARRRRRNIARSKRDFPSRKPPIKPPPSIRCSPI